MSFKAKVTNFLKTFDLFAQPVTFRYNDEPEYESATGGVCSIIMIIVFFAIFTGTTINTFNKQYIISNTEYSEDVDPSFYKMGTDTFMFAVSISGINMNQGDRWFDVYMQFRDYDNVNGVRKKTIISLQKCSKELWQSIDKKLGETYQRLNLDQWLCPTNGTQMNLQGKFTSQYFKFYKFAVKKCDPLLNPQRPCADQSVIQGYLDQQQAFNFNFYFVNMIINPGSHQYLSYYLDDLNYFPFSLKSGINANLFLSTFKIETDQSIYPFEQYNNRTGGIVLNTAQILNYEVRQDQYLKFYLRKSSLSILVERAFRKVDDTLSYIGGLFSAIIAVLIIMKLFNEFSYELEIAKNLYHYEKQQPLDYQGFHFFTFLGYMIYMIFDKIGVSLPWKKMKIYHHSLQQVRKQMDINLIMKKILYSQRMAQAMMNEHQAKILHLQEPLTLQQAEQIRKDHTFYQTLEDFVQQQKNLSQQRQNRDVTQLNFSIEQTGPSPFKINRGTKILPIHNINEDYKKQSQNNNPSDDQRVQQEKQLKMRIEKMRQYIAILQSQSNNSVSQKILNKFDKNFYDYFIRNKTDPESEIKQRKFNLCPKQLAEISENEDISGNNIQLQISDSQILNQLEKTQPLESQSRTKNGKSKKRNINKQKSKREQ